MGWYTPKPDQLGSHHVPYIDTQRQWGLSDTHMGMGQDMEMTYWENISTDPALRKKDPCNEEHGL